ncbi:DNA gyrase inhibitor YacG [Spiribacter sp. 2438]|uniref:DNA gyrase inhibitor YacG n=1 Tax=Spiribacter sp. 2438 TaxID=2666185 RepID=UPI001E351342|nr:DNA gyrase inhibitor YacG [Spiribacter sp. 2438]
MTVSCPNCGAEVPWTDASEYRPFCSKRCRLIDLGQWFEESHRIPGEPVDLESPDETERDQD